MTNNLKFVKLKHQLLPSNLKTVDEVSVITAQICTGVFADIAKCVIAPVDCSPLHQQLLLTLEDLRNLVLQVHWNGNAAVFGCKGGGKQ